MQQRESARDLAAGKWAGILGRWLEGRALAGKHGPCPICQGKDRFRFDDKEGAGTWICSHCGAGDGFHLLQKINSWSFQEAAKHVEGIVGNIQARAIKQERQEGDIRSDLRKLWEGATKVVTGDPVWHYLERRCGITSAPMGVRYHPALAYFHDDGRVTTHPAMLAQVLGCDGAPLSIHRTYLTEAGEKAKVPTAKKLMTPVRKLDNVAIRLARPIDGWLGVAEGIETALCASRRYSVPVWACVSAGLMETFRPPEGVEMLTIFGDNDTSFTGQASAYKLARVIAALGIECRVAIPSVAGTDWADEGVIADGA